ncbi:hypothetical protein C1637_01915 [Chryseobacterium lactis]|uniref:DUF1579 domain-containing protein n=1 Tax=Chryseobacterium lactis TaxID=1241981 RepID=A0A3G6RN25_CHRLC|nr:DUF1579 domain-containing protein [Chryseobacterium lactis]AZA81353.1 DUF1579 domain-containing protein [Chryseobacterium lactis]AZB06352.1 DUF1579 domain-containing protein [Chryseobacterium lactis]PNW15205.1 hypothetical protein C1637_01915 [Chryseobacterium lactis]
MKNSLIVLSLFIAFTACEKTNKKKADNSGKTASEPTWNSVDSAMAAKTWTDFRSPGEMHKVLEKYKGNWKGEVSTWIQDNGKAIISKSECTNTMILGGRYLITNYSGTIMGQPFEVMKTMGYDKAKKKFVSTLIDNMGTGFMQTEGEWNAAKKTISFKGKMPDPIQPGKEWEAREVYTFIDDQSHTVEIFGPDPKTGKVIRTMEVKFTRQ